MKRPKLQAKPVLALIGLSKARGVRRNSVIQIVIVLVAVLVLVRMIGRSEQNPPAMEGVRIPYAAGERPSVSRKNNERSPSERASPANLRFTHLSVADGLSYSDVRAIAQDRQGFMWFGTWLGGLNRYDGYTFKVYRHDDQDNRSLGCDRIWALYVDRAGVLWVGTIEGVDRYDRDTDSFVHYRHRAHDPSSLPGHEVRFFYEDESGTLWVSTNGGLSRFDGTSGRFFTYRPNPNDPSSFGDTSVRSICLDRTTGLLWVGTGDDGVIVLDRSTGHYTRYKNNPNDPVSLSTGGVQFIYQDRTGTLWISTMGGLNRFDPQTHTFIRYLHDPRNAASLSDDYVTTTYEDRAGRFWVATNNGLNLMDRAHGTFARYLHDPNDSSSLSSNVINLGGLYVDASGALWIAMRSTGVDRLAGAAERFTTYRHNPQDANSLSNNVITGLWIGSEGAPWIGTEAGLDRFDGRTFTHYLANPNNASRLSPGPERSVVQDSHGAVWTGTFGGGLDRLNGEHVTHFRHDPENPDSPACNTISSLVPDAKGGLWIGVYGKGVDYFDGLHFTHFPPDPANPTGLPGAFVRPRLLDGHGMLWICDWGLVRFDTQKRQFKTCLLDPNQLGDQAANGAGDVYSDGASIWVASSTGLYRFDPERGKFTHHYTEKDGLANNLVVGVLGDAQGNVWVSTANGISRFDPRTEKFRNYDVFDGLQGNLFSLRARAKAPDGRLFFGGVNGLSAFYPDKLPDNPTPPPVVLTEFELFNKPARIGGKNSPLRQAINVASRLTLRHDQSVFRFQFSGLDFTAPQKNRYAYKLDGFDRDWQYTDASRRFATYTHLDPGDYTFSVKASNNDGIWNEQGIELHIRILPPWWGTWWFRALSIAAFLTLLWAAYQVRVRQLQEQEKRFREAVETMPALAFVARPDGYRTFVNRGWVEYTGMTVEQASGSGWQAAVHPDDLERVINTWQTSAAAGERLEYETRLRHGADGEYRWFQTRATPLRDKRGKLVKWCGVATDIEDRKRAEQLQAELAHSNRVSMMGELAASIAHEVNQPLAGVVSNGNACLRWLAADVPNVEEARENARRIVRDGKRAGEVIARIRSLTKRGATAQEQLDLNETIQDVLALVGEEAKKKSVITRTQFADDLPPVSADRVQLQQVMLNLVMNAIEAMSRVSERARELAITTRNIDSDQVQVTVEDSGIGIEAQPIDKIFDSFYTTKPGGMGMGLSISRSILQAHGGRLWATANDGGTFFHFTLPKWREEQSSPGIAGR
jgi:PAS domain S-box-containing protein